MIVKRAAIRHIDTLCAFLFAWIFFAPAPRVCAESADGMRPRWSPFVERAWIDLVLATQGSPEDAAGGVDGVKDGAGGFHTENDGKPPWWQVDLGASTPIDRIVVYNRDYAAERANDLIVQFSDDGREWTTVYRHDGTLFHGAADGKPLRIAIAPRPARYVRATLPGADYLHLDEIEVYGPSEPDKNIALGRPATQSSPSAWSTRQVPPLAELRFGTEDLPAAEAILTRTLETTGPAGERLRQEAAALLGGPQSESKEKWLALYAQAARLRDSLAVSRKNLAEVDLAAFERLVDELAHRYPGRYVHAREHTERLRACQRELPAVRVAIETGNAEEIHSANAFFWEMQKLLREILLFDVEKLLVIRRHEIDATHVYTYHYEGFQAGGGLYVVSPHVEGLAPLELVASPEGEILDCDLSYDGKTVLFSWRRSQDEGYHLWQVDVDGSNFKQLTEGAWHDYNACWLPDGGIGFLSSRSAQFAYCWNAPVGIVHRMNPDGSDVRQISANYLNDFTPYPLEDGRIIYSRWEYVDKPAIPIQSLWTINPDGTNLSMYFGNGVLSPGTFMEARSIPGTTKIICTMTGHNGPTRGAIGVVDRSRGLNAQEAIVNITPDTPVPAVDEGNGNTDGSKPYSCPFPLDADRILVSARGPVLARTIAGDCKAFALADPEGDMPYFNAQPVRPRPRPPVLASSVDATLGDGQDVAKALPMPGAEVQYEASAVLYMQDIYDGLEPTVKRGDVKRIRVVREMPKTVRINVDRSAFGFQFPVISCGATYAGKTVLGEVPVEPDGSAAFRVPAGMPIYFMALDAEGRAVQRMRSFTHLMPSESQGCIGCHEPRLHAARPTRGSAYGRSPRDLEPPEWGVTGFDYSRLVQPVLDQYCIGCHKAVDPPKGIDLTGDKTDFFNVSYETLARENQGSKGSPYVSWIPTYNGEEQNILEVRPKAWGSHQSRLAEIVHSGHPDKAGKPRFAMDERSRRRIYAWIDLNVPYYGTSETAYPELRGCRQIYPESLDKLLKDVAQRRCAECHSGGNIPRREWVRITNPELNDFLLAPLASGAGGSGKCGRAVFADKNDPDYRALLESFNPNIEMLRLRPRMDMANARPAPDVCRDCK